MANPTPIPIKFKPAARKLPIKRKASDPPLFPIKHDADADDLSAGIDPLKLEAGVIDAHSQRPSPPFKFHRIWPEADEIRLLQGLLDSAADGFVFPRDLSLFYERFSRSTVHPYTKSQLSEKLRRLRKKFHALSARLSRGLDSSLLTPHDRSLFHLSKQLWHPSFAASSPFTASIAQQKSKKTDFTPSPASAFASASASAVNSSRPLRVSFLLPNPPADLGENPDSDLAGHDDEDDGDAAGEEEEQEDRRPAEEEERPISSQSSGLGRVTAKAVMDVLDSSLKEVRTALVQRGLLFLDTPSSGSGDLVQRWREQRAAELDALTRRLRLVLERSLHQ